VNSGSFSGERWVGESMSDSSDKYRAPALDKGLDILEFLAASVNGLTQVEIAKGLGRGPNEIYRMLDTLVRRNYVTRTPDGDKYMLSLRLLAIANMHPPRRRLLDIADPLMRDAAIRSGQSVHLAVWEDGQFVITSSISAPGNWRLSLRIGSVIGLFNTGSGMVLASFQDEEMRTRMVREHQLVDNEKPMSAAEFAAATARIRERGYELASSSYTTAVLNISFPVFDPFGNAMAAVTCPYVAHVHGGKAAEPETTINIIRETAAQMTSQLNGARRDETE